MQSPSYIKILNTIKNETYDSEILKNYPKIYLKKKKYNNTSIYNVLRQFIINNDENICNIIIFYVIELEYLDYLKHYYKYNTNYNFYEYIIYKENPSELFFYNYEIELKNAEKRLRENEEF